MRRTNRPTMVLMLAAMAFAMAVAAAIAQDGAVSIYEDVDGPPPPGQSSNLRRVGGMVTDGGSTTIICSGGVNCEAGPCAGCHTAASGTPTAPTQYSTASASRHFTTYFPKAATLVAANSRQTFGPRTVTTQNGRLVTINRDGTPRLRMPNGAQLIRTQSGPVIAYPGSAMPEIPR